MKTKKIKKSIHLKLIGLIFLMIVGAVLGYFVTNKGTSFDLRSFASSLTSQATVSFVPAKTTIPASGGQVAVYVNSFNKKVGFARVTVSFDRTKVQVNGHVEVPENTFTVLRITETRLANERGQISIVVGIKKELLSHPPTGSFKIASIPFRPITNQTNVSIPLLVDLSQTEIVDLNANVLNPKGESGTLILNSNVSEGKTRPETVRRK